MDDKQRKSLESHLDGAIDALQFMSYNKDVLKVNESRVKNKYGLDVAMHCLAEMMQSGMYRGERIGVVNPNIPEFISLGNLSRGGIVLYELEEDGKVTVYFPLSAKAIDERKAEGSLNFVVGTIVGVPVNYIWNVDFQ